VSLQRAIHPGRLSHDFDRILSGVSHEISNYSQSIMLFGQTFKGLWDSPDLAQEWMSRTGPDGEGSVYLETLIENAKKVHTLMTAFKEYGRASPDSQPIALGRAVHASDLLLSEPLRKANCPLTILPVESGLKVHCRMDLLLAGIIEIVLFLCDTISDTSQGIQLSAVRRPEAPYAVLEAATAPRLLSEDAVRLLSSITVSDAGDETIDRPFAVTRTLLSSSQGSLTLEGRRETGIRVQVSLPAARDRN
jgi:hypothetical protein